MRSFSALCLLLGVGRLSAVQNVPAVTIKGIHGAVQMPLLGIGTWQYNNSVAKATVTSAFELGYRHVDTASSYENQIGVGEALANLKLPRESFFITSKIPGGLNASATAAAADSCLKELNVDYVDLMLIHFPADFGKNGSRKERQVEWKALEAWAKSGKAKAIGVSHYCRRQLDDILQVTSVPVAVNQVQYHVGMGQAGGMATDDKNYMKEKGVLYQSFSPLCGPCDPPDNQELLTGKLVTSIGKHYNKTGPQVALRWLVQQGIPVIPKSHVAAHQKENSEIFDFELNRTDMWFLNTAIAPAVGGGPSKSDSGDCGIEEELVV